MRIKPYRVSCFKPDLPADFAVLEGYRSIKETGVVSNFGPFTKEFENIAKDYLGNPNVMATSSCDTGLNLLIKSLDLPAGAGVIVPSFTFTSTVNAITWNGLLPIYCDIDKETLNIDFYSVEKIFKSCEFANIKLIIATHIFGNPVDMYQLEDLAAEYGVSVIYDAAHAYGSKYIGKQVGRYDHLMPNTVGQVYSFSGTKLVTTGEGGLIACRDEEVAEKIKYLRGYGFYDNYNCVFQGLNGKISEFNAMIGTNTLPTIDDAVIRRNELAGYYRSEFGTDVNYQQVHVGDTSTYKDFAVLFESKKQRDRVFEAFEDSDIQTKKYFMPVHQTSYYERECDLPNTQLVYDTILCLPMYNSITKTELEEVVSVVKENL